MEDIQRRGKAVAIQSIRNLNFREKIINTLKSHLLHCPFDCRILSRIKQVGELSQIVHMGGKEVSFDKAWANCIKA